MGDVMGKIRVRIQDNNHIPQLRKTLNELKQYRLEVGVFGDGGEPNYVMIASVHEFGAVINNGKAIINIPERSFLRSTFDEKEAEWYEFLKKQIVAVVKSNGKSKFVWEMLGTKMVADIQKKIRDLKEPPNAPSTIATKGSSSPLIDTGGLRQRITYRVVKV